MYQKTRRLWKPIGWGMSFGLSLILVGCGGDSTAPKSEGDQKPIASTDTPAGTNAKPKTGEKGGKMAPGGELSREERRAAKLREKDAAGK
jgi:hypothetical protein